MYDQLKEIAETPGSVTPPLGTKPEHKQLPQRMRNMKAQSNRSKTGFYSCRVYLDTYELKVLQYGLKYIPARKFSVKAQLEEEIKDISNRYIHLQVNSKLIRDAIVQTICPFYPNMRKEEYKALNGLAKRKDIVVKQADKGQAIVVMSKEVYEEKANTLLRDTRNYIYLSKNPLWTTYKKVKEKLNELISQGHIPTKCSFKVYHRGLPKLPNFYILPKVHKKGCPGRPIVAGIGYCTEEASRFLCQILQPFVDGSPAFIDQKYSRHFYRVLNSTQQFLNEIENL
ncbi:unnamed protein product, partial [Didymodactylos carnosus]